jgi:hypothetical protein
MPKYTSFTKSRFGLIAVVFGVCVGVMLELPLRGFTGILITISEVVGLDTELSIRPIAGVDYIPGSVVYVDSSGFLESVPGPLSNCVTVGGSTVPCGTGSPGPAGINFADSEVPAGVVNGTNVTFTLVQVPNPTGSLQLFRNGIRLSPPGDYVLTPGTGKIMLVLPPGVGDAMVADYRY